MAVARSRVAMKCAPQVFLLDQFRKGMFFRSFKFAAIFTQLRRNEIEIESAIKFGLIAHLRNFLCPSFLFRFRIWRRRRETIFIQRPAALQRAAAQPDIVLLISSEISEEIGR